MHRLFSKWKLKKTKQKERSVYVLLKCSRYKHKVVEMHKKVKWFLIFLQSIGSHNLHTQRERERFAFSSFFWLCVYAWVCARAHVWKQAKKFKIPIIYFLAEKFLKFMCIVHTRTHKHRHRHTRSLSHNWLQFPILLPFSVWIVACLLSFGFMLVCFCFVVVAIKLITE